ncbi:MAG TPA: type II toxin-antitoxin system VapC family toxin [Terriglobales bacterium]|nr:type II toxin-antitoxin system VapC family toxin [Terriglobales bacterium]
MKLLLDTHVWLWSVLEPARLAPKAGKALLDPGSELWLSPISIWELSLLIEKRRFRTDRSPAEWVAEAHSHVAWRDAPLTAEVAIECSRLRLPHGDPADRFLVATARTYALTLVTADASLLALPNLALLPAR